MYMQVLKNTKLDDESYASDDDDNRKKESSKKRLSQEEQNLLVIKIITSAVLIISALALSVTLFIYISNTEYKEFETQFQFDANKVLESIGTSTGKSLGILDEYATAVCSEARFENQSFPNVTIPDFAIRAAKYRSACGSIVFSHLPLVTPENRLAWESYAWNNFARWVNSTKIIQSNDANHYGGAIIDGVPERRTIYDVNGNPIPYDSKRLMLPLWLNYPTYNPSFNYDWLSGPEAKSSKACIVGQKAVMSEAYINAKKANPNEVDETESMKAMLSMMVKPDEDPGEPVSNLIYPILNRLDTLSPQQSVQSNTVVAVVATSIFWRDYLKRVLSNSSSGIVVVFVNPCNPTFTYQIDGPTVKFLGHGDKHVSKYDKFKISRTLIDLQKAASNDSAYTGVQMDEDYCPLTINVYASDDMKSLYLTTDPLLFATSLLAIFALAGIVLLCYYCTVERRQQRVVAEANKTDAIVTSLFPTAVRSQLIQSEEQKLVVQQQKKTPTSKGKLNDVDSFLNAMGKNHQNSRIDKTKPLADLYPETTIIFADFAGFTAWSSTRDPTQVFMLLETVYGAFDQIATARKVFKVETIGDCYVAVTGLPEPDKHHAVRMARFACACLYTFREIVASLSSTLGPETIDLSLRVGLNSGPTTAGVLRGDKARFQLFGDTVNTASRMESTGIAGRIQVSQKTADLLVKAGKGTWIMERTDSVLVKGKGIMNTYWIDPRRMYISSDVNNTNDELFHQCEKTRAGDISRLVEWNVDVFVRLLKQIISHRSTRTTSQHFTPELWKYHVEKGSPFEEMTESIKLSKYDINSLTKYEEDNNVQLGLEVENQLRQFIMDIANLYNDHPFHNFEHASHVVMSTTKLLSQIDTGLRSAKTRQSKNDEWSKGQQITIDPLSKFAIAFSALVQDVDHPGVPNSQLMQETSPFAHKYNGQCVAEQNAIDIAWTLFAHPSFAALHRCLFATEKDVKRFRQLVVNSVLATDIYDPELTEMRDKRWKKLFSITDVSTHSQEKRLRNQTAALVVEHIIQASDVCHYMQHWKIYEKWNELRFHEMYKAYKNGRSSINPTEIWYYNELTFFDQYIIPLAKKLKMCSTVFGVSCGDEFLDYAQDNRLEWEIKGREIVQLFLEKAKNPDELRHPTKKCYYDDGVDSEWYVTTDIDPGQSFV